MEHLVSSPGNAPVSQESPGGGWEHVTCNLCGADDGVLVYPGTLPADAGLNPKYYSPGPVPRTTNVSSSTCACTSLGYGIHPPIVRCRRCGLVYTNPRRAAKTVEAIYAEVVDELYLAERDGRVLTFQRHLGPIETMAGPGNGRRLLDVGCYIGVFVEIAASRGWDAWGIEPSRWAAAQARARGLQVITGTMADARFEPGSFDVLTMWDVIEHMVDPAAELHDAWRVLRPGGLIAIHTVDIDSPFARLMGARWPWLMEMHLVYFSPATLSALLMRTGFQVVSHHRQGRTLRLGYLVSRLTPFSRGVARATGRMIHRLGLATRPVRVNLGDLFTIYARKPDRRSLQPE